MIDSIFKDGLPALAPNRIEIPDYNRTCMMNDTKMNQHDVGLFNIGFVVFLANIARSGLCSVDFTIRKLIAPKQKNVNIVFCLVLL